jgi:hypothetical protein
MAKDHGGGKPQGNPPKTGRAVAGAQQRPPAPLGQRAGGPPRGLSAGRPLTMMRKRICDMETSRDRSDVPGGDGRRVRGRDAAGQLAVPGAAPGAGDHPGEAAPQPHPSPHGAPFGPDCLCWCQVRPVVCILACCECVLGAYEALTQAQAPVPPAASAPEPGWDGPRAIHFRCDHTATLAFNIGKH